MLTDSDKSQAFELCTVRDWNLSYTCLTSFNMRQALRNMNDTNPEFWNELTKRKPEELPLPEETKIMPEDTTAELENEDLDDSEVPIKAVVASLDKNKLPKGIAPREGGLLMSVHAAESLDLPQHIGDTTMPEKSGPGKRRHKLNTLYRAADFWRHNDSDGSDIEAEEWDATCERHLFWHQFPPQPKTDFFTQNHWFEWAVAFSTADPSSNWEEIA
jgi:hypothetical protein